MKDVLVRRSFSSDWFDLGVGEASLVREAFFETYGPIKLNLTDNEVWNYQAPHGYKALVRALESKYNAPVIITCGAKQGLNAAFYSLRKRGHSLLGMRSPYWSQLPQAIIHAGLRPVFSQPYDSYLLVSPNNPDGYSPTNESLKNFCAACNEKNIPVVHDAAYYTQSYLSDDVQLIGNLQIHSISKTYGLSGLRLGYVVCNDTSFYNDIMEYVELATVGVSGLSQNFLLSVINLNDNDIKLNNEFHSRVKTRLSKTKEMISHVDPNIFDASDATKITGMFGWFIKGPEFIRCERAKINVIDGSYFGDNNFVRVNLAIPIEVLQRVVDALR